MRGPAANFVSEKGLYTLIGRSDKPIARKLQDWLNGTVLPSIRKDHGYIAGEEEVVTCELSEDELDAPSAQQAGGDQPAGGD